jgi:hypothetical protein
MDQNLRERIVKAGEGPEFTRFLAILIYQLTEVARFSYTAARGQGETSAVAFRRMQVANEIVHMASEKLVKVGTDLDDVTPEALLDAIMEQAGEDYAGGIENILRMALSGLNAPGKS